MIKENRDTIVRYLEPVQLGMSVGGGPKLVNSVRMVLENNQDFVCVKMDFRNAFNEVSRAAVLRGLSSEPSLQHMVAHVAISLAPAAVLEVGGRIWGEAQEGTVQGDPESTTYCCVAIQPEVIELDKRLAAAGGLARAGCDDVFAVGPPDVVFTAVECFAERVERECGLVWQKSKTEVFSWNLVHHPQTPDGLIQAGVEVGGVFCPGFLCYGVPVGSDPYVGQMLDIKVSEVEAEAARVCEVMGEERQALWSILRSSLSQKMDYWLQLVHPSQIFLAAERMDRIILGVLKVCGDLNTSPEVRRQDWVCTVQGRTFQDWVTRLPIKLGGLGLRSLVELSPAAYLGGLEQSLPHFVGEGGVCPQVEDILGDMRDADTRWHHLLESGTRTGLELQRAWDLLQEEAREHSDFLGREVEAPLSVEVVGAGDGCRDGGTRGKVVQQLEQLRHAVLTEGLTRFPNRTARPVWTWNQRDKLSGQWLLALPGPHTGLSAAAFSEAMCNHLCLPSPACSQVVGRRVGKMTVDLWGDAVTSQSLPGDGWRVKHDSIKLELKRLMRWCKLPNTCEVFNLFSHLIPQEGLTRLEWGRKRQALVPDFRLLVPSPTGGSFSRLAEVKFINCCETRYPREWRKERAVDRRASTLQADYVTKARKVDQKFGGAQVGQVGRVERELSSYGEIQGLVFGAWGEASKGVHELVETMAKCRVRSQAMTKGRLMGGEEKSVVVGQIRRCLSVAAVRANSRCLLDRLHQVGQGVRAANGRREAGEREEVSMRKEREGQWMSRVGKNPLGRGKFFLN